MAVGTVATATAYTVAIVSTAAASAADAAVVFDVPAAALPTALLPLPLLPLRLLPLPLLPLYRCIKKPFESNRVKQALGPLALPAALLCTGGAARIWHTHVRPVQSTSPSPLPTSA